jgi:hypothetical protein
MNPRSHGEGIRSVKAQNRSDCRSLLQERDWSSVPTVLRLLPGGVRLRTVPASDLLVDGSQRP